jgi:hypothetical protein
MDHMIVIPIINRKQDHSQSSSAYVGYLAENAWLVVPGQVCQPFLSADQLELPSVRVIYKNEGTQSIDWATKFSKLSRLREGWNGYTAPAPLEKAILTAKNFVDTLLKEDYEPKRLAPSAVGGVGVTQRKGNRSVYVEFYNDGRILALFSDDVHEPEIKRIAPGYKSFKELIAEMRDYLDA